MRWPRLFPRPDPPEVSSEEDERLDQEVDALQKRTRRAADAAEQAINVEIRQAYETILADRRGANRGHAPERRHSH